MAPSSRTTEAANGSAPAMPQEDVAGLSAEQIKSKALQALSEPDRVTRMAKWMHLLAAMTEENADILTGALIESYRAGVSTGDEGRYQQFREGQVLGARVMETLTKDPNGVVDAALPVKMKGWASVHPEEAGAWIEALAPGSVQNSLRVAWLEGAASASPAGASQLFSRLPEAQQMPLVNTMLSGVQERGGFPALRDWFDSNSSLASREVMTTAYASIMDRFLQKPRTWEAAEGLLKAHVQDGFATDAVGTFVSRVGSSEPGRCLDLIESLGRESPQLSSRTDEWVAVMVSGFGDESADTLGTWLNGNQGHHLYDQVVQQFSQRIQATDPEAAHRWAATIKDPARRASALSGLGR